MLQIILFFLLTLKITSKIFSSNCLHQNSNLSSISLLSHLKSSNGIFSLNTKNNLCSWKMNVKKICNNITSIKLENTYLYYGKDIYHNISKLLLTNNGYRLFYNNNNITHFIDISNLTIINTYILTTNSIFKNEKCMSIDNLNQEITVTAIPTQIHMTHPTQIPTVQSTKINTVNNTSEEIINMFLSNNIFSVKLVVGYSVLNNFEFNNSVIIS